MNNLVYGSYVVLRVVNQAHVDEHTNVGIATYGPDGKQLNVWVDTPDRAIRRGDLAPDLDPITAEYFSQYLHGVDTIDKVKRRLETFGHAMSCVQLHGPMGTVIDGNTLGQLYDCFVLGKMLKKDEPC